MLAAAMIGQMVDAIDQIEGWSTNITSSDSYFLSPEGMKTLAATGMLLVAIGEGVKKLDAKIGPQIFAPYSHIDWKALKGMRDYIAHRYFDIDADIVFEVVSTELQPLKQALIDIRKSL